MASLSDVLTALQNGVVAMGDVANQLRASVPLATSDTVTTASLVVAGKGRLFGYSVVIVGTTEGKISDCGTVGAVAAANALSTVLKPTGWYPLDMVFDDGLVVTPGTGMSVNVTYSLG